MIRHYHGHLSGVYALAVHPTLDVLMTGGRDSVCRVWDMRTKCAPRPRLSLEKRRRLDLIVRLGHAHQVRAPPEAEARKRRRLDQISRW